jgi:hypothetical protein
MRRYRESEKNRVCQRRYEETPAGRRVRRNITRRYRESAHGRAAIQQYEALPERKRYRLLKLRRYRTTLLGRACREREIRRRMSRVRRDPVLRERERYKHAVNWIRRKFGRELPKDVIDMLLLVNRFRFRRNWPQEFR